MIEPIREFLDQVPQERQDAIIQLYQILKTHLPEGFECRADAKFIHFVVPHSLYAPGYHCNPKQALPFVSLASQKNFISLYHMGLYADQELMEWFVAAYPDHCKTKLDMGKSCIRFKKTEHIPFQLLGELLEKMTVQQWIEKYEHNLMLHKK
ncbi:DUF1801 domain-containing protein [Myroides ceti]|uniref:DUF1801 domain-containing protein n=1 Tax=Paenimyroides ceti TaxID=395087 RepID=A0ABT8CR40_9FLAO|nr:DUF1801 domain-containing protein [Paenimyroides ceti]MDN3706631.1 DUF1801 domain-containing protein [Paenimyroides ceti]